MLAEVGEGRAGFSRAGFASAIYAQGVVGFTCLCSPQPAHLCPGLALEPHSGAAGARRAWHTSAALPLPAPSPLASRQDTLITKQYRGSVVVLYFLFSVFPCLPGDLQLSVACGDHADGGLEAGLVPSSSGCWTMAVSCCHSGASHRWAAVSSGHSMKDTVKWALLGPCPALGQKGVLLLGNR